MLVFPQTVPDYGKTAFFTWRGEGGRPQQPVPDCRGLRLHRTEASLHFRNETIEWFRIRALRRRRKC